ncbi:MAG: hypothetical protein GY870_18070, partial [archaeon]|nr:hypothetical protein [archaeon]
MAEYSTDYNVDASTALEEYVVIIDIGGGFTKVGFAGEETPRAIFPTITGKEKYKNVMVGSGGVETYVGEDCAKMRGVLKTSYPISRGNILDWDAYFAVLTHIFYNVLRIDPSKAHIIYAESALTPLQNKQYIARVLFETYKAKSIYIASAPILSLFSTGLTTGIVVESGEGLTWVVPIVNGKIAFQAVQKLTLAGLDVNEYLKTLLLTNGISLSGTSAEREILREIKEKNCFIALNPEEVTNNRKNEMNNYVLPDGETVQIGMDVRVNGPEIIFHPELLGYNIYSIQQAIIAAVSKVDRNYWRTLLQNIILSGGNMQFQGLQLRLEEELNSLLYQLGPLPQEVQNAQISPKPEKPKMVNVEIAPKQKDTCPKCGAMVNVQESQFCPDCGNDLSGTSIK